MSNRIRPIVAARLLAIAAGYLSLSAHAAEPASMPASKPTADQALGRTIERAVATRDADAFNAAFDGNAFVDRVFTGYDSPVARTLKGELQSQRDTVLGSLVNAVPADAKLTFLHARTVDGERRLTFRLFGSQGLNYWDVILAPAGNDEAAVAGEATGPRAVDLHVAIMGENFSQTLRRLYLRMDVAGAGKPNAKDFEKQADQFQAFMQAARGPDARKALALYDALSDTLKRDKIVQVGRVAAASKLPDDPDVLLKAADEFKRRFGDDPACDLVMIDAYLNRKQLAAANQSIDRVNASVGGDPFLEVIRANAHLLCDDPAGARRVALAAHQRDPQMYEAVDALLNVALATSNFDDVRRWLDVIESTPAFDMSFAADLNNAAAFKPFMASPQYELWLAGRQKK